MYGGRSRNKQLGIREIQNTRKVGPEISALNRIIGSHNAPQARLWVYVTRVSRSACTGIHPMLQKSLPGNLKLLFEDVLKIVNFIKSRDVNSRIFKELCKEMGEKYEVLLYHTDVRWLSRGKVLHRVIELRKAIQEFLEQKGSPFATKFTDKEWLARLRYLADIFAELNCGNLQLQGRNTTSDQETASLQWIIHPFSVPDEAIHDDDFPAKEEWITVRANEALKIELQNQNADSCWISRLAHSPTLSKRALKLLVSFSTTYLCEKGFSTVLGMKTKKKTRLNVANDARLALSTTKPRIPQLASNMQLQPSH
ncbi:Ribonuclease H-like domain [Trinorchestia longiramus]|nr:Ribonuclease H-like domain [Trinorchestia longiramus]